MAFKRMIALAVCSVTVCSLLVACSSSESKTAESETEAVIKTEISTESASVNKPTEPVKVEDTVAAKSGDAYLAIADGSWYVQYWGTDADLLSYDAGVVPIEGDGDYTVSVNGASKGMIYDVTGIADGEYIPSGCSFMAVIVKDGALLHPNMSIDITGIRVNGVEIERNARNYTASDDGAEMKANIFNEWVKELPEDAHDANGTVTDSSVYSPRIIDTADIGEWTKIEVDFTVSGINDSQEE